MLLRLNNMRIRNYYESLYNDYANIRVWEDFLKLKPESDIDSKVILLL